MLARPGSTSGRGVAFSVSAGATLSVTAVQNATIRFAFVCLFDEASCSVHRIAPSYSGARAASFVGSEGSFRCCLLIHGNRRRYGMSFAIRTRQLHGEVRSKRS